MNIKKWMYYVIFIFGFVAIAFFVLSFCYDDAWIEILGVTLITSYYHICIRPLTGSILNLKYHNNINWNHWWFKEKKFEKRIYKFLKVKKWKKLMPTYDKDAFNFEEKSLKEIIGATCQAELVHELMLVESFLPLFLIIPYGRIVVFVSTTIFCIFIELIFIMIQRYNRPRLLKLYSKISKNN